jgi:hypothetical protein
MLPQCIVFVETTEVGSRKSGCIWIICCRSCIWCSVEIAKVLFLVDGHFGMWEVYQLLVYTWGLLPSGMCSQALRDWTYQYSAPIGFSMCLFSFIPFPCCLLIFSVFSYLSSYLRTLLFPYSNTLYIRGPNLRWYFIYLFFKIKTVELEKLNFPIGRWYK